MKSKTYCHVSIRSQKESNKAFEWLERITSGATAVLPTSKAIRLLRNIEKDPRYRAFLQKMKLPLD